AASAQVQPPDHATSGAGQAVLDEIRYLDTARSGYVRVEGTAEESALINMRRRSEQERPGDSGDTAYVHHSSCGQILQILLLVPCPAYGQCTICTIIRAAHSTSN